MLVNCLSNGRAKWCNVSCKYSVLYGVIDLKGGESSEGNSVVIELRV
jgi:hypothetical protein